MRMERVLQYSACVSVYRWGLIEVVRAMRDEVGRWWWWSRKDTKGERRMREPAYFSPPLLIGERGGEVVVGTLVHRHRHFNHVFNLYSIQYNSMERGRGKVRLLSKQVREGGRQAGRE